MEKHRFISFLENPGKATFNEAEELKDLQKQYPYFYVGALANARIAKAQFKKDELKWLSAASLRSVSRTHLPELLEETLNLNYQGGKQKPAIQEIIEAIAPENAAFQAAVLKDEEAEGFTQEAIEEAEPQAAIEPVVEAEIASTDSIESSVEIDDEVAEEVALPENEIAEPIIEAPVLSPPVNTVADEPVQEEGESEIDAIRKHLLELAASKHKFLEYISEKEHLDEEPSPLVGTDAEEFAHPEVKKADELIAKFIETEPGIRLDPSKPYTGADLTEDLPEESEDLITENFAEILVKQGKTDRAIAIYEKLVLENPEKADYFAARISELKAN